jgi:helix-turn-helix protein
MATTTAEADPTDGRQLLSYEEAAEYLGPSFTTRWVRRQVLEFKTIRPIRLNRRTVIEKAELDRYVERAKQAQGD